jgi:hypothetical protein
VLHWRKQGFIRTRYPIAALYIYRVDFNSGTRYKIGVSIDPGKRVKTLVHWQTPQQLVFFQFVRHAYALEAGLHEHFHESKSRPAPGEANYVGLTEWFTLTPQQIGEIARLVDVWELVAAIVESGAA